MTADAIHNNYPEHEKFFARVDDLRALGEFIEFLDSQGIYLAQDNVTGGQRMSSQTLLYRYVDVDPEKFKDEQNTILSLYKDMP